MEIGKLARVTQATLQGEIPDGAITEHGEEDPTGLQTS